jgi:hypothetical protein
MKLKPCPWCKAVPERYGEDLIELCHEETCPLYGIAEFKFIRTDWEPDFIQRWKKS